jgi:hypothetical protein
MMKNRESYSTTLEEQRSIRKEKRERKTNVIRRKQMVEISLNTWDVDEEDELAHLESLLDQIEPILDTPFKS